MFVEALVWWRGVEEVVWCCVRSYEERICMVCMSQDDAGVRWCG